MEEMIATLHEMVKMAAEKGWIRGGDLENLLEDMQLQPELIRAVFRYLEKQEIRVLSVMEAKSVDQALSMDQLGPEEQKLMQMIYSGEHTLEDIAGWLEVGTDLARKIVLDVGRGLGDIRYLPCRREPLPDIPDLEPDKERQIRPEDLYGELAQILSGLTEKEAEIMEMLLGLKGRIWTREEVAAHFGLTPERIRQIENKALRKAYRRGREKKIRDFCV